MKKITKCAIIFAVSSLFSLGVNAQTQNLLTITSTHGQEGGQLGLNDPNFTTVGETANGWNIDNYQGTLRFFRHDFNKPTNYINIIGLNLHNTKSLFTLPVGIGLSSIPSGNVFAVQGNSTFNGKLYINTTVAPADAVFAVNGRIYATGIRVELTNGTIFPDYVFDPSYKLSPLSEVESYIKANKHLPEVPSAKEVEKNGIDMANMDAVLLKKIEELTLYIIELKKEVEILKKQ